MGKKKQVNWTLSPKEMEGITNYRFRDWDHGFQRDLVESKVNSVAEQAAAGLEFPPPMLAEVIDVDLGPTRVRNKQLVVCDGQHRIAGHIRAGVSLSCQVILGCTAEHARRLFLLHNSSQSPVRTIDILSGSRSPVALDLKRLMARYDIGRVQINSLAHGVFPSAKKSYMDSDILLSRGDFSRLQGLLEALTSHSHRWWRSYDVNSTETEFPSIRSKTACSTKFLKCLGKVARTLEPEEAASLVAGCLASKTRFDRAGVFSVNLNKERLLEGEISKVYNHYRSSRARSKAS
ncbi:MAG: hypothetical protein E4G90_00430 [Gemmatimonadales bacterium]|nr:MAG: hypothetical protein E4G90_00430 [Gemmatimonadales bacterium]